jgi:hypothetical protein
MISPTMIAQRNDMVTFPSGRRLNVCAPDPAHPRALTVALVDPPARVAAVSA